MLLFFTLSLRRDVFYVRILNKESDHWTLKMLNHLKDEDLGWARSISEKLKEYCLEPNWDAIKSKTKEQWKREVKNAVNNKNKQKLIDNCTTETLSESRINTKTKHIYDKLTGDHYIRKPLDELVWWTKQKSRAIILARNGMLECGKNDEGIMKETCTTCAVVDDENHRLNDCVVWRDINCSSKSYRTNFSDIYSRDYSVLEKVIPEIEGVWDLRYTKGRMKH